MLRRRRTVSMNEHAVWPDALPRPNENFYFSVTACNDSRLVWGFHDVNNEANCTIWSNPFIDEKYFHDSNRTVSDRVADFSSYVSIEDQPGECNPRDYIFGGNRSTSMESASWEAVSRGCKITVYVVGTNTLQLQLISKLFASIPSRLFFMKSTDFFSSSERSNQIGLNSLAALRGAAHCNGFPSILFDAGDTLTYTAADEQGHILGGGISPGLLSRVNNMIERKGLDQMTLEEIDGMLEDVASGEQPLQIFSNSTTESILAAALSEVSSHATNVVKMWLEKVGSKKKMKKQSNGRKLNSRKVVSVTGKHATVIEKLLQRNNGGLIESPHHKGGMTINTSVLSHVFLDGVKNVIAWQTRIANQNEVISLSSTEIEDEGITTTVKVKNECSTVSPTVLNDTRSMPKIVTAENISYANYINKRVIKQEKEDQVKEGVIRSVVHKGFGIFSIEYDDGSTDNASIKMIKQMMKLYKEKKNLDISGCSTKTITPSRSISTGTSSTVASYGGRKRRQSREESMCRKSRFKGKCVKEEDEHLGKGQISSILTEKLKDAESYTGKKVAKKSSNSVYIGEVIGIREMRGRVYYRVKYSDGDEEDLNVRQVEAAIYLYRDCKPTQMGKAGH